MKIKIDNYTPLPTVSVIGCEQGFGCESLDIEFGEEWKNLKKYVTLYFSEDDTDNITVKYNRKHMTIPERAYEKSGLCRYVIKGESKRKRLVCKTGYLRVLKSPETLTKNECKRGTK